MQRCCDALKKNYLLLCKSSDSDLDDGNSAVTEEGETDKNLRANNVSGAFGVSERWDLTGMTVIIVDDVATTGATLHEAAVALYNAGASKVLCIALAGNRSAKNTEPF